MNYPKIYDSIIDNAKSENRKRGETYYENHHIIPKCLNGSDYKTNRVLLTAREHFVCHKLLTFIYPDHNGIKLGFVKMCFHKSSNQNRIKVSSWDYEYARKLDSEAKKGNKNRLGKKYPHTEETKKHLSEYFKENVPVKAFKKGQIPWNKNTLSKSQKKYIKDHSLSMLDLSLIFGLNPRIISGLKNRNIDPKKYNLNDNDIFFMIKHTQTNGRLARRFNTTPRVISIVKNSYK